MRIKTFTARTMTEAMAQVRAEMGPEAIIVSTGSGRSGRNATVTAAIEPARAARRPARRRAPQPDADDAMQAQVLDQTLGFHNVPEEITRQLTRAAQAMDADSTEMALAAALDTVFRFQPLADRPGRPLMLIGPPGAGKTVTLAKLAARALLAGAQQVRLITTDVARAGAVEQLATYGDALELPLATARDADELRLQIAAGDAPTLIDSSGVNPFDAADRDGLKALLAAGDIEPVLVLAAGMDAGDMADAAGLFAELGARRLVITRLDAARRLGAILATAQNAGTALAEISLSPYVADSLQPVNPVSLARLLLHNAEQPHSSSSKKAAV
jgi:flagellar biosynthesis protein FlhF